MMAYKAYRFNKRITTHRRQSEIQDPAYGTRATYLSYRRLGDTDWDYAEGIAMLVPDTNRVVHTVELSGLVEDSIYEFRTIDVPKLTVYTTFNNNPSNSIVVHWHTQSPHPFNYIRTFSQTIHKFKTLPSVLHSAIRFAHISDTHGHYPVSMRQIFEDIGSKNVRCIIHSGDMSTCNGNEDVNTWYVLFDTIQSAVDSDGCIIPILPNIGNHEIALGSGGIQWDSKNIVGIKPNFDTHERGDAEWYYCFFPKFPGLTGYGVIDFGDYASVWQLDPGITTHTNQGQDTWLANTLAERENVPHKLLSYHYSPFPTGRRVANYFAGVRRDWCPIYEPYKPLVLTGHEHVWSVTVPILGGSSDLSSAYEHQDGVVYLGSSPSGNTAREGRNPHTKWWIKESKASIWNYYDFEKPEYGGLYGELREPHVLDGTTFTNEEVNNWWMIELEYGKRTMTAFDLNRNQIYSFVQNLNIEPPVIIDNLITNGDFRNGTNSWYANNGNASVSNNVLTVKPKLLTKDYSLYQNVNIIAGHKYYMSFYINPPVELPPVARLGEFIYLQGDAPVGVSTKYSFINTPKASRSMINVYANGYSLTGLTLDSETKLEKIILVDLTNTYGEQNEPTLEEFEIILENLPYDIFA